MPDSGSKILFYNGKIWGDDGDQSWMVIDQTTGYVTAVGKTDPPLRDFSAAQSRDLQGQRVLPGLQDSHIHVSVYGEALRVLDLRGCTSIAEFKSSLKSYVRAQQEVKWIIGRGWDQEMLGRFPTKEDLDEVCPDIPVFTTRVCIHIAAVNSKALQLLGVTKETPSPVGGTIDRFPEGHPRTGEPTGVLRDSAVYPFAEKAQPDDKEITACIKEALNFCLRHGLTAVHAIEPATWRHYCELADNGELPIRVFFSAFYSSRGSGVFPAPGETRGPLLSCDRVKFFTDGSLGGCTAAMTEPYLGTEDDCGLLIEKETDFEAKISEANSLGYRLEIHIIGDRAAEVAISTLEKVGVSREMRPILTHCSILPRPLLQRAVKLGCVGTVQPQFLNSDGPWIRERVPARLHPSTYAWKSLAAAGLICGGGSDAPVETAQPLIGMYDAIYRQIGKREPGNKDIYCPDEGLSMREAIALYTKGSAYVTKREHDLGRLLPGYKADFVIINSVVDICEHPDRLLTADIREVWVDGCRKYLNAK